MNPLVSDARAGAIFPNARIEELPASSAFVAAQAVRFGPAEKLFVAGCLSGLAYIAIALFFWTDAVFTRDWKTIVVKMMGVGIPAILYLYGIRFARRTPLRVIIGFAVLFAVVGCVTLPFDSTDAFFYIADGWRQFHYGQNPYSDLMRDIPHFDADRIISNRWMAMNKNPWLDSPFPYGFGFAIATRTIAWIGAGNLWGMLALLNVLNLSAHIGMTVLLWKTARFVPGADPRLVLYLYTWNPIVLTQSLANAHNDILMAFGILAAAYFVLSDNPKWSIPVLVLAGLIKYGAFILLPFACLVTFRSQGVKAALKASVFGGLLGALAMAPYWPRDGSFKYQLLFLQTTESGGSLHAFAATLFRLAGRVYAPLASMVGPAASGLQIALGLGFLCFLIHQFLQAARSPISADATIQTWTTLLFAAICIVSPQFYSWYLVILTPLAVLSAGTFFGRAALVLTATHVLAFADLRRKSIGYFAACTLLPMVFLYWRDRRDAKQKSGAA